MVYWRFATTTVLLLLTSCFVASAEPHCRELRVMSFNVRYGTAPDGDNHWRNRQGHVADTVRAFEPDLLGVQEALAFQRDYLDEQLPVHEAFGVGRDHGDDRGEMTAVFYRRDRFERLDGGHLWLSETPDVAGSKGWDARLPRMATWIKLRDRTAGGEIVWFFNTHFDHLGLEARLESAKLLRERIAAMSEGRRAIIVGDFNAMEASPPYVVFFGNDGEETPPLVDTYRGVHPQKSELEGTLSFFHGAPAAGGRIDWIGVTPDWTVNAANIVHAARDGRAPSDHFPVSTVLCY